MAETLTFPYPGAPPPSPFLGGTAGGPRSYEHVQTGVRADIEDGLLRTPVPRASFHAEELATALGLGDDFRRAFAQASRRPGRPETAPETAPERAPETAPETTIDAELGLAWWRFTCARGDLRRAWPAADIVIPELLLFARKPDGGATTVLVWPADVRAMVIPDAAEHIIIKSDPAHRAPPSALVPRAQVIELAGAHAVAFDSPVPHRLYRGGADHPHIIAGLRSAPGEPARAFRAVRPDAVIDSPA